MIRPRFVYLFLGFFWASFSLAQGPQLTVQPAAPGEPSPWVLHRLPQVLDDDEVREHLDTGLTTSFVLRLTWRSTSGTKMEGGARAQVRYELWDELYEVAVLDGTGQLRSTRLDSFDALQSWWKEQRIALLETDRSLTSSLRGARGADAARVTLDVVPFSQAEQRDAQRWFSESLEKSARSNTEEVARSVDEEPEKLSRVLGLLMATSIQRRALVTYRWNVTPMLGSTP